MGDTLRFYQHNSMFGKSKVMVNLDDLLDMLDYIIDVYHEAGQSLSAAVIEQLKIDILESWAKAR